MLRLAIHADTINGEVMQADPRVVQLDCRFGCNLYCAQTNLAVDNFVVEGILPVELVITLYGQPAVLKLKLNPRFCEAPDGAKAHV